MRAVAGIVAAVVFASACTGAGTRRSDEATVTAPPPPSPREPRVARFETGFNVLEATGVSCDGLHGPWRVEVRAPQPIEGGQRTTFRLPGGRGPGRLRWSFTASHPGHGEVTYSGEVTVRASGTTAEPVLRFSGTQTSVGVTGQLVGSTHVRLGGRCPDAA